MTAERATVESGVLAVALGVVRNEAFRQSRRFIQVGRLVKERYRTSTRSIRRIENRTAPSRVYEPSSRGVNLEFQIS